MTGTTQIQARETVSSRKGFQSNQTTYKLEEEHVTH